MKLHDRLILTGFMGAGKSAVGRLLASRLGLAFLDTDESIVLKAGMPISEIFKKHGEQVFRAMEREVCCNLPKRCVVALGGGAFIQDELRHHLQKSGLTLFLDWPFPVLAKRILKDSTRPLAGDIDTLRSRFEARLPLYYQAHLCWQSQPPHHESPQDACAAICEMLRLEGHHFDKNFMNCDT